MSDTEASAPAVSAVESTPEASQPATTAATPVVPRSPDAAEAVLGNQSRRARIDALKAKLDKESDEEANDKILGKRPAREEAKAADDEEDDKPKTAEKRLKVGAMSDATVAKLDAADDKAKEEKRLEDRRRAAEAKTKGDDVAPNDEAHEVAKAEEAAPAEEEATAEEAAEAKPEEAAADKPDEAAAKQEKERKAKFERVLKMEAEARKRDEKLRAREEGLKRVEADLQAKSRNMDEQYKRLVASSRKDVETAKTVLQLARENPLELLERAGIDPLDVAKWVDRASDPVAQKLKEVDRRFEDLQRREREVEQQRQQAQQQAQRTAQRQDIEKQYLSHFDEQDGDEHVFEAARFIFSPQERIRLGDEIAQAAHGRGMTFTSRDIAEAVDAEAREDDRWKALQKRMAAAKPAEAAPAKVAPKAAVAPARVAPRPTVVATNAAAQDSAPAKPVAKPAGVRALTPKEQRDLKIRKMFANLDRGE